MRAVVLVVVLAVAAAGCSPHLSAQSSAPPGRLGSLDPVKGFWGNTRRYELELSSGTALAIGCEHGGPCKDLVARSLDPAVVRVVPATQAATASDRRAPAVFVAVGLHPGSTWIVVKTRDGLRRIEVTVAAPPTPAPVVAR